MILAIDQSYTGTGACYISDDGRIETLLIHTKSAQKWEDRIDFILKGLDDLFSLRSIKMENPSKVDYVVLESYAYSKAATGRIFQLGELGGIIKYHFHTLGVDADTMLIEHPKMFIARNGRAGKQDVIKGLKTKYGIVEKDDNVADAIAIGLTYRSYLQFINGVEPEELYDKLLMERVKKYVERNH